MHGLYVGNAARPRMTGQPEFLKGQVKSLTSEERKQGWTIAPVRTAFNDTTERTSSIIWVSIGVIILSFLLFIVFECAGVR